MGNIPVLKPAEVARLLSSLGFQEIRQRDPINNTATLMDEAQQYLSTRDGIFLLFS
jgi:hypothetical protein